VRLGQLNPVQMLELSQLLTNCSYVILQMKIHGPYVQVGGEMGAAGVKELSFRNVRCAEHQHKYIAECQQICVSKFYYSVLHSQARPRLHKFLERTRNDKNFPHLDIQHYP
jgi:hypothetical protein